MNSHPGQYPRRRRINVAPMTQSTALKEAQAQAGELVQFPGRHVAHDPHPGGDAA